MIPNNMSIQPRVFALFSQFQKTAGRSAVVSDDFIQLREQNLLLQTCFLNGVGASVRRVKNDVVRNKQPDQHSRKKDGKNDYPNNHHIISESYARVPYYFTTNPKGVQLQQQPDANGRERII